MTPLVTRVFRNIPAVWIGAGFLVTVSCQAKDSSTTTTNTGVKASAAALSTAASGGASRPAPGRVPVFQIPVGPRLAVLPGQGLGAVRFGATLQTVERLMEAPCSEKTEAVCRYAAHAVDFHFKDGVVAKIQIHGEERPFGPADGHSYGIFNGLFPQGAALGMYAHIVIGMLGEPTRLEKVTEGATVERHFYSNFVLEYDRLKNGNVVLASIILEKPQGSKPAAAKPAP
ncbi:MAG: hypothetical protein RJA70_2822 [Pseudomonadota bacterium]|jgi:hypothetical protein